MSTVHATGSPKAEPPTSNPCPRCGKPLTDAAGLGWCQSCGFCRSLEEAVVPVKEKPAAGKPSLGGLVELGEAVGGLPRWVWIALLGMAGFTAFSILPASQLPQESFDRALWTTCQIGAGLAFIFVAQLLAVVSIAPYDEKISFKDVLLPFRLWALVCKRLPRTYLSVWLGSWGLSLIVSALILVGGLPYWMNYLPGHEADLKKAQHKAQRR